MNETRNIHGLADRTGAALDIFALTLLCGTLVGTPLLHGALDDETRFLLRMAGFGTAVLALVAVAIRGRFRLAFAPGDVALLAFLGLLWLSVWTSPYRYGSTQSALDLTAAASAFAATAALGRSAWRRRLIVLAIVLGGILGALGATAQWMGWEWLPTMEDGRLSSWYRNPNHFAGLLDLTAPLALGIGLFATVPWITVAGLGAAAWLLVALGGTFSYGGWLSTGVAVLVLLAARVAIGIRRGRWLVPLISTLAILAIGVSSLALFLERSPRLRGDLGDRVQALTDIRDISSFRSRRTVHQAGWQMALDHPWVGVGPGNFSARLGPYRPPSTERPGASVLHRNVLHPLNDYLHVATSSGFVAAVAFVVFWLVVLVTTPFRLAKLAPGVLAALIAILLHGLVDGNLTYVTGNAFVAFALAGLIHPRGDERRRG